MSSADLTARQIRGSTALFAGRIVSLAIGMATQILLVRALSRESYGAFAFALALTTSARTLISMGEDQAFTRFVTMYDERKDDARLFGTYVMAGAKILSLGAVVVAVVLLAGDLIIDELIDTPDAYRLLAILVFLAPIDAFDRILEGSFAVFSKPSAIFVRKYIVEPGLRLLAVVLLVVLQQGAAFVAAGYVAGAALGLAVYAGALVKVFRERGLLSRFDPRRVVMPVREYFAFSLPLLSTEFVNISVNTVTVLVLARAQGADDVAGFRAIFPAARLNQLVIFTFAMLFTPLATRYFTRSDREEMAAAYWRTAAWVATFTFPVAAATIVLAEPVTVTMFGSEYRDAATYLAILSSGYYLNAALGFNALTLQIWGKLRWVVVVNLTAGSTSVVGAVVLVPRFGAAGAAASVALALVVQNAGNQIGLRRIGIPALDGATARLYGLIGVAVGVLTAVEVLAEPHLVAGLALVAATWIALVRAGRDHLAVGETFPELRSLPVVGRLVGR